jgi:hypothetical protein
MVQIVTEVLLSSRTVTSLGMLPFRLNSVGPLAFGGYFHEVMDAA